MTARVWKKRGSDWLQGQVLSPKGQSNIREGCSDRLCELSLWIFPGSDWTQTWTIWTDLGADPVLSGRLHRWPPKAVQAEPFYSPVMAHTGCKLLNNQDDSNLVSLEKKSNLVLGCPGGLVHMCVHIHICASSLPPILMIPDATINSSKKTSGYHVLIYVTHFNRKTACKCLVILLCFDISWGKNVNIKITWIMH